MNMPTVITPMVASCDQLMQDLVSVEGGMGIITGSPGVGKSFILQRIAKAFPTLSYSGGQQSHLHAAVPQNPTGVGLQFLKDIYFEVGGRKLQGVSAPHYVIKMLVRAFKEKGVRLLLIDEAQYLCSPRHRSMEFLQSLRDYSIEEGHPLIILMATNGDAKAILSRFPATSSRILKSIQIRPLTIGEMGSVLRSFGLIQGETNDPVLLKTFQITKGFFRKITYFSTLHQTLFPGQSLTSESVACISERMDHES